MTYCISDTAYEKHDMPAITVKRRMLNAKQVSDVTFIYKNADDLATVEWDRVVRGEGDAFFQPKWVYPLCKYACMNTVPDDVDPEYLSAVREMIFVVFQAEKNKIPSDGDDYATTASETVKNRIFADWVLRDLARRFGDGGVTASYADWCH